METNSGALTLVPRHATRTDVYRDGLRIGMVGPSYDGPGVYAARRTHSCKFKGRLFPTEAEALAYVAKPRPTPTQARMLETIRQLSARLGRAPNTTEIRAEMGPAYFTPRVHALFRLGYLEIGSDGRIEVR